MPKQQKDEEAEEEIKPEEIGEEGEGEDAALG